MHIIIIILFLPNNETKLRKCSQYVLALKGSADSLYFDLTPTPTRVYWRLCLRLFMISLRENIIVIILLSYPHKLALVMQLRNAAVSSRLAPERKKKRGGKLNETDTLA